jgi:hypothetical protein
MINNKNLTTQHYFENVVSVVLLNYQCDVIVLLNYEFM